MTNSAEPVTQIENALLIIINENAFNAGLIDENTRDKIKSELLSKSG
jgi:hypothetical protein